MILRPYQQRAIAEVRAAFREVRRVCLVAPTGFGKTATAAQLIAWSVARGRRVLFLVHRREIVMDTHRRLVAEGVACGLVMAGEQVTAAAVQVASVQTVAARSERPPADLVVWDEAHHVAAESYRTIAAAYPGAWHLGLTATPERSDGVGLADAFDRLVVGATVRELTDHGYLAPCEVIAPASRLQGALAMEPADAWREHADGRPTVAFAATIAESRTLAGAIGERAAHLDGSTGVRERERILGGFARGDIDVLCNVFVLTEGWDCARAEVCLLARGASSASTYLQMIGRVLRVGREGKRATLIDLVGAVHEHGLPDEDRAWSLEGGAAKRGEAAPWLAQCAACGLVSYGRKCPVVDGRRTCPRCGVAFVGRDPAEVRAEKMARAERAAIASPEAKREAFARYAKIAAERGFKPGWAGHQFKARFGHWPRMQGAV